MLLKKIIFAILFIMFGLSTFSAFGMKKEGAIETKLYQAYKTSLNKNLSFDTLLNIMEVVARSKDMSEKEKSELTETIIVKMKEAMKKEQRAESPGRGRPVYSSSSMKSDLPTEMQSRAKSPVKVQPTSSVRGQSSERQDKKICIIGYDSNDKQLREFAKKVLRNAVRLPWLNAQFTFVEEDELGKNQKADLFIYLCASAVNRVFFHNSDDFIRLRDKADNTVVVVVYIGLVFEYPGVRENEGITDGRENKLIYTGNVYTLPFNEGTMDIYWETGKSLSQNEKEAFNKNKLTLEELDGHIKGFKYSDDIKKVIKKEPTIPGQKRCIIGYGLAYKEELKSSLTKLLKSLKEKVVIVDEDSLEEGGKVDFFLYFYLTTSDRVMLSSDDAREFLKNQDRAHKTAVIALKTEKIINQDVYSERVTDDYDTKTYYEGPLFLLALNYNARDIYRGNYREGKLGMSNDDVLRELNKYLGL